MTKFKKVIAMMLALLMAFSSMSAVAMAWDTDELVDTELSIRTEYLKEVDGNWVVTNKVVPGQAVKARIYVGTNYYSNDSELLFHYDDSFFDVIFEDGEVYDLASVNAEAGISARIAKDSIDKVLLLNVKTASENNALYDGNVWLFDIPLTVKSTATGKGRIYVEQSDIRNTDNPNAYVNVPAGPEDGTDKAELSDMEFWDVETVNLDVDRYVSITTTLVFHANGGEFEGYGNEYSATGDIGAPLTDLPEITREGWAFRGWTAEEDGKNYFETPSVYPENDADYYAYWDKTVDLVFNAGEGLFDGNKSVETYTGLVPGEDFTAPANPTRDGYTFIGWDKDVPEKVPMAVSPSDFEVTYTAQWANNVTLRFYNDEEKTELLHTTEDGYAGKTFSEEINVPSKAGFYFAGWSPELPEVFPNEDTDYVAQWEDRTYTVTYFVDGAFRASAQVAFGAEINLDYPAAQADYGYKLNGWHLGSAEGRVVEAGETMPGEDIKLYSTQSILTDLPATFKSDANTVIETRKFDFDEKITAPENPTRAGYNFIGWDSELGVMDNINGKTFVAVWEPIDANVEYYLVGQVPGEDDPYASYEIENGKKIEVPADPYTAGYTFTGWATQPNQETGTFARDLDDKVMEGEALTYFEARTPNEYKLKFNANGGSAVATQSVTYGANIVLPSTTRTGYTFNGWKDEGGATYEGSYTVLVLGENGAEMTFTAQWTIEESTITFADTGDSSIAPITANYGTPVARPADPTKAGHYFTGWDKTVPATMPAEDMTITAQWATESYIIKFDSNGGAEIPDITASFGEVVAAPTAPEKAGYTFAGWYAEGSNVAYDFANATADLGDNGAVVNLKAKWTNATYTITFDSDGGSAVPAITESFGAQISRPADPTKAGNTFAYWYEEGNENAPFVFDKMPARNVTLKAMWNDNSLATYKVIIREMDTAGDYAEYSDNVITRSAAAGTTITFADVKPTVSEGFVVVEPDAQGAYQSDASIVVDAQEIRTLYIYIERVAYDLTFVADDGDETVIDQSKVYFGALLPQLEAPEKTGFEFDYWINKATGNTVDLANDTMPASALVLKAHYSAKFFDADNGIKFSANGGSFADSTIEKRVAATFGKQINAPTAPSRNGYEFKGWAESANSNEPVILPILTIDLNKESLTYYAVWEAETYENAVIFDANGGEFEGADLVKTVSATFGGEIDIPDAPVRYGYEFKGWATTKAASAAEEVSILSVDLSNTSLTYYAVWQAEEYNNKVSFDANGGKYLNGDLVKRVSATFGEEIVPPTAPAKEGYRFAGWMEVADNDSAVIVAPNANLPALNVDLSDASASVTYYAKWVNAKDTAYTVTVFTMGVDGKYDKGASTVLSGTTGAIVRFDDVKPALSAGFEFGPHDDEKAISADGKMVFSIYVDRAVKTLGFVVDGEPYGSERQIVFGADIAEPVAPAKAGYDFDYWYVSDEAVPFDFASEKMPANDLSLTAKFSPKSYDETNGVKFNANGGSFADTATEKTVPATFGQQINVPAEPSRYGYEFKGWSEGSHAGATVVEISALTVDLATTPLTYYAVWQANSYDITNGVKFDANGGSFANGNLIESVPATFGQPVNAPEVAIANPGYTFAGWAASASESAPIVAVPGAKLPALNVDLSDASASVTYYAKWMSNGDTAFKVAVYEMNTNGSYNGVAPKEIERSGNSGATVTFAQELSYIVVPEGFAVDDTMPRNDIVINGDGSSVMAIYLKRSKAVATFLDDNDAVVDEIEFFYGEAIVAPAGEDMEGRVFVRWEDANHNAPSTMPLDDITFKAVYNKLAYTVKFYIDDEPVADAHLVYGEEISFDYPAITVPYGYELSKWYYNSLLTDEVEAGATVPGEDINLYAAKTPMSLVATFDAGEGKFDDNSSIKTVSTLFDAKIVAPETPTREGYEFVCWNPDVGVMDDINGKTFVAVWNRVGTVKIVNYYNWNNELYQSYEIEIGKKIDVPADPHTPGYTFTGWATQPNQESGTPSIELAETVMPDSNLNYYEARITNTYKVNLDVDGVITSQDVVFGNDIVLPAAPTKEGCEFTGWMDEDDVNHTENYPVPALSENGAEMTLTAQWKLESYTIKFNSDGGTEVPAITASYGAEISAPAAPTKIGSTFLGWYAEGSETAYEFTTMSDLGNDGDELELTAHWEEPDYTINFDSNEGSAVQAITAKYNADIERPADPTKEGYTFDGWFEEGATQAYTDFSKMPARNVTLKAKWTIKQFEISFDSDGGSAVPSITKNYGAHILRPADPTKTGYTFGGWFEEGATQAYTDFSTMPSRDVTLKAKWTIKQFKISFDSDGGSAVKAITADFNAPISRPPDPKRDGYKFAYWYETNENTPYNDFSTMPARSFTLKAKWNNAKQTPYKVITHTMDTTGTYVTETTIRADETGSTITLEMVKPTLSEGFEVVGPDSTEEEKSNASQVITADGEMEFHIYIKRLYFALNKEVEGVSTKVNDYYFDSELSQLESPTKYGYEFKWWYEGNNEELPYEFGKMPARDVTLKAHFVPKNYDAENGVKFDANGGLFADASTEKSVPATFGQPVIAPEAPTREGHTFAGWAVAIDAEALESIPALSVDLGSESLTYYAKWNVNSYEVTFNSLGGSTVPKKTVEFGKLIPVPEAPTMEGHTFAYWYEGDNENEEFNFATTKMPASNVTLNAKWEIETYNIKLNANGGAFADTSTEKTVSATYGQPVVVSEVPTREGYTFVRWYETDENVGFDFSSMRDIGENGATLELNAKWEIESYKVTFNSLGGSEVPEKTVEFDKLIPVPENPTKEGYTFAYWYEGDNENEEFNFATTKMPASDVTLNAKWEIETYNIKLNANGGAFADTSTEKTVSATYGQPVVVSEVPTREGYTFVRWYETDENVGFDFSSMRDIGENGATLELNAKWEIESYKVTFNTFGGSEVPEKIVEFGKPIPVPEKPTKEGYTFDNWYETDENVEFDFSSMRDIGDNNAELELKALWKANEYTITFDADGGEFSGEEVVPVTFGDNIVEPEAPTKEGYTFAYWYEGDNENEKFDFSKTMPARSFTLKAKWNNADGVKYTIVLHKMTTEGVYADPAETIEKEGITGSIVTYEMAKAFVPELEEGFVFGAHDDDKSIEADGSMKFNIYIDRCIYALNTDVDNNGTVTKVNDYYFDSEISPLENPTKYGYEFKWWYEGNNEELPYEFGKMPARDVTLKAHFVPENYDAENGVKFNANGGLFANEKLIESVPATFGQPVIAPETPAQYGYEFKGWAETADATEEDIIATLPALSVDLGSESLTYYAVWAKETYDGKVIFNANGGLFADASTEKPVPATFDEPIDVPAAPTRDGYDFVGWTESAAEDAQVVAISKLSVDLTDTSITYFAKWKAKGDTAYFVKVHTMNADGSYTEETKPDSGVCDSTVNYADVISNIPVEAGFEFVSYDSEAEMKSDESKVITADGEMIFNIYIARSEYNAVFMDEDGETVIETVRTRYGAEIVAPVAPEKEGKRFNRWIDENGNEPSTMPIGGASFTAEYENNSCTVRYFVYRELSSSAELVDSFPVEYGSVISAIGVTFVATEGYDFDGQWYTDRECTIPLDANATITSGIVDLYGKETIHTYTVTFDANGGKFENGEATVSIGATILNPKLDVPADPTREGYVFAGWSPTVGQFVEPGDKVYTAVWDDDFSIYYKWLKDETNSELGYEDYDVIPVKVGENMETPDAPYKEGYDFLGWSTEEGETTNLLTSNEICARVMSAQNETFYAVFAISKSEVTYKIYEMDKFGNYGEPDFDTVSGVDYGTVLNAEDYIVPNGFSIDAVKSTMSLTVDEPTEVMEIYLSRNKYHINYYLDENDETPAYVQEVYFEGYINIADNAKGNELVAASTNDAIKYGKEFYAWDPQFDFEYMPALDNLKVYAELRDKEFTVIFYQSLVDAEDVRHDSDGERVTVYYGSQVAIPDGYTEAEGYDFVRWEDADGNEIALPFTVGNETPIEMEVYAVLNIHQYTIRFYLDEESKLAGEDPIFETELPYDTDLYDYQPDMTDAKEGHDFDGWNVEPGMVEDHDMDFWGIWTPETYTVKFKANGGSFEGGATTKDVPAVYGESVAKPADPTLVGSTFLGWFEEGATESFDFSAMPDIGESGDELVLEARWTTNPTYTISFDSDGGSEVDDITAEFNAVISKPADPTKEGNKFLGWYEEGATEAYEFTTMPERDVTLKAKWDNKWEYKFIADDENNPVASGFAEYNSDISAVVPTSNPTAPAGQKFIGWSATKDGTTPVTDFGKISTDVAKNTFYAIFVDDAASTTVTVTFNEYNGSSEHGPATDNIKEVIVYDCFKVYGTPSEVESGSALVLPEAPVLANYTFAGWFDAAGKEWVAGENVPADGLNLYAKYVRVQCGLIAKEGSTTVIERGATNKLNNLDDVASYTEGSYWFVYGLTELLKETDMLADYVDVSGDCRIEVVHSHKTRVGTGSTITVIDNVSGEIVEKFYIIIFGDLDGNGAINGVDVNACQYEVLGNTTWSDSFMDDYDPIKTKAANVDGKKNIRGTDTNIIRHKVLGNAEINQVTGTKA